MANLSVSVRDFTDLTNALDEALRALFDAPHPTPELLPVAAALGRMAGTLRHIERNNQVGAK